MDACWLNKAFSHSLQIGTMFAFDSHYFKIFKETMMALNLDSYLGIHAKALIGRDQRASILANNLANSNTPHYKATDVDFNALLTASMDKSQTAVTTTSPNHMNSDTDFSTSLKYRNPTHESLDGNTVDKERETTEFARNALHYQASLSFLNNKIKSMAMALRGE